jgi:hypothetical protein
MEASELQARLLEAIRITPVADGFRVATQCLYPSNGSVIVTVRGGVHEFIVSDDGGAAIEIGTTGLTETVTDRQIRSLLKMQGLHVSGGVIASPRVQIDAIPAAVMLVANASKEVADWGLEHLRFPPRRNFRKALAELLERHFHDNLKHDAAIIGASNKSHKFSNVIYLSDERRLLIDPVINDPSSINARVVANLDVKMANDPNIQQLIVFDDELDWSSSDLKLLEVGARTVPFSLAERAIERLAA